ncbi:MAG TPA: DUF4142 domain-containing protein [Pseudonocardia sp.]
MRFVRVTVLGSVLLAILVSVVLAGRSPSSPQSFSALFGGGTTDTRWGPLSASDRDMLIKVRQANLWEGPAGEQAAQSARDPAVREVGRKLGIEHAQLDAATLAVAAKLNVPLPSQPSDAQKVWMSEIASASPDTYDKTFVNVVRSAHGEVMPLVEGVRSGTQNELVRQFAIEGSTFIARHMEYLESTGLVDYALFPPSTAPAARLTAIGGYNVPITLLLFVVAVLVSAAMLRGAGRRKQDPGGARSGWWARLGGPAMAGRLGGLLRTRPDPSTRDDSAMVTTAELIAVLNPPTLGHPGAADSGPAQDPRAPAAARPPRIPSQRVNRPAAGGLSQRGRDEDRRPPRLGKVAHRRRW